MRTVTFVCDECKRSLPECAETAEWFRVARGRVTTADLCSVVCLNLHALRVLDTDPAAPPAPDEQGHPEPFGRFRTLEQARAALKDATARLMKPRPPEPDWSRQCTKTVPLDEGGRYIGPRCKKVSGHDGPHEATNGTVWTDGAGDPPR